MRKIKKLLSRETLLRLTNEQIHRYRLAISEEKNQIPFAGTLEERKEYWDLVDYVRSVVWNILNERFIVEHGSEDPTHLNVLPEYDPQYTENEYHDIYPPNNHFKSRGAIVAVLGCARCPWCNSTCVEKEGHYLRVCTKNPKHVVQWLLWGG